MDDGKPYNQWEECTMNNKSRFLALGLVFGGFIGIIVGSIVDNLTMGIVLGGGFGIIIGFAIGTVLDKRIQS